MELKRKQNLIVKKTIDFLKTIPIILIYVLKDSILQNHI